MLSNTSTGAIVELSFNRFDPRIAVANDLATIYSSNDPFLRATYFALTKRAQHNIIITVGSCVMCKTKIFFVFTELKN